MTGMTTRRAYLVRLGLAIITVPTLGEAIKGHASAKPTAEGSFGRRLENAQDLCVLIGAPPGFLLAPTQHPAREARTTAHTASTPRKRPPAAVTIPEQMATATERKHVWAEWLRPA